MVQGVFPVVNQLAYTLDDPGQGVPLVRAWVMGIRRPPPGDDARIAVLDPTTGNDR